MACILFDFICVKVDSTVQKYKIHMVGSRLEMGELVLYMKPKGHLWQISSFFEDHQFMCMALEHYKAWATLAY